MSSIVKQKGRDKTLIINRNKKLCARFYYYSNLIGLRFEKVIKILTEEFDLSESRIADLISENTMHLIDLEVSQITEKQLKKKYPFFSWNLSI